MLQVTTKRVAPVVTCDGRGVVSHAGMVLLDEVAERTGLTAGFAEAVDVSRVKELAGFLGRESWVCRVGRGRGGRLGVGSRRGLRAVGSC